MIFDWYKVLNRAEFEATQLVSREYEIVLQDRGLKTILATRGNYLGLTLEGVFLAQGMAGQNPYSRDGMGIYQDTAGDVWIGYEVPEE